MPNSGPSIPKIACLHIRARQKQSSAEIECRQNVCAKSPVCQRARRNRNPTRPQRGSARDAPQSGMPHRPCAHPKTAEINRSRANNAVGPHHPPPDPADEPRPEPAHIARRAVPPGQRRLSDVKRARTGARRGARKGGEGPQSIEHEPMAYLTAIEAPDKSPKGTSESPSTANAIEAPDLSPTRHHRGGTYVRPVDPF
jgi:hypothetical protein